MSISRLLIIYGERLYTNLPRNHDKICNILPRNCDNNYILYRSIHIFFALPCAFFRLRQSC